MADIRVKVNQDNLKVRVGQQNSVRVISAVAGLVPNVENSFNVIGGIASVSQLYISGISTFAGTTNFANITNGVAYFNSFGQILSTGSTSNAINYSNYIITTNNAGITTWSSTIDGGEY
jgi:hypothetical protein